MKIHHLRNATLILTLGERRLLVDPMLSPPEAFPGFKVLGGGRRPNPLVAMPPEAEAALSQVTDVLITHEHPDHFDAAGVAWTRARGLPVWASSIDVPSLRRKGLAARELREGELGLPLEVIPTRHGRGLVGWMMGPVAGLYLAHPQEPSVYLTSDSVLTSAVLDALARLRPDVVVAPAGAANFGAGPDILFSVDELVTLARSAPGEVVFNHLEALDHCPTTRAGLRERIAAEGLGARVHIPRDGEALHFTRRAAAVHARPLLRPSRAPGFQKWLTSKLG
ncbi:MAG TPA: MBL fold metallo-hydrolase [Pseudomonadota bacterium]|nr:MBL fold metallo-hydrolase [Pseudomonadota bacterium]